MRYTSNTGVEEGTAIEIQTKGFGGVKLGTMDTYMDTNEKEATSLML